MTVTAGDKRSEGCGGVSLVTRPFGVCFFFSRVAGPCLLAQVLHLQNKQVIVASATVILLPPSALLCLCVYSCLLGGFYPG